MVDSYGMRMSSWRNLASSKLSPLKGLITQQDVQTTAIGDSSSQGWKLWGKKRSNDGANTGTEQISLFPGWATRRYRVKVPGSTEEAFEVEVFISGVAASRKGPQFTSRSQRAFMRLAKGFAAIPKLAGDPGGLSEEMRLSRSTEELMSSVKLPPRPTEITEDLEVQALEEQFRKMKPSSSDDDDTGSGCNSPASPDYAPSEQIATQKQTAAKPPSPPFPSDLRRLYDNLESRLQPFWATALSARTVRINLTTPPLQPPAPHRRPHATQGLDHGHVVSQEVQTGSDGYFEARFRIGWEDLCQHPRALHIAFGGPAEEHDVLVLAELLPPRCRPPGSLSPARPTPEPSRPLDSPTPTATSALIIPITHSSIRLISDIDDTVKFSNILSGARAVFRNVFVKEFHDNIIPGMGEWYNQMWKRGVRFHYVSNGPFELLPVVNEFLRISQLPQGSIKLRSYAVRSLFNGLLSAPATRKRPGVVDVLEHFPDSKFLLVGDSGEQDLELYAAMARERPWQVVGVFVRDVNANALLGDRPLAGVVEPIDDPTGVRAPAARRTRSVSDAGAPVGSVLRTPPRSSWRVSVGITPIPRPDPDRCFTPAPSPLSAEPEDYDATTNDATPPAPAPLRSRRPFTVSSISSTVRRPSFDPGRKRQELQMRVWAARSRMPSHIPLRVFRSPEECVEVWKILGAGQ